MKLAVYNEIVDLMQIYGTRECLKDIAKLYHDVSMKTLGSIYSQEYQKKMKKCHYKLNLRTPRTREKLYQRYLEESQQKGAEHVLLKIADKIGLAPSLLCRIVVEQHVLLTLGDDVPSRTLVSRMIKDTTLIEDPVLANEVQYCVVTDDVYGPLVDSIKHSIGHEQEFFLQKKLEEKKLAYLDEHQLRARGYDKTPDFKLEVPIAVDGHVVNWIESKASFGDEDSHRTYLKEQFWSYWNRFGPGLVIYWFGFIEELDTNRDKGIMLMDCFPEDIVTMNPTALTR